MALGYIYDEETGLYYCQSRYYDPEIGRWLNADSYASTGDGPLDCNMFAYCGNNPVMGYDPTGDIDWETLFNGVGLIGIGAAACLVAATVVTGGACAPLLVLAGATFAAGGMTIANGAAEVIESATGYNYMRDGIYQEDVRYYEKQKVFFQTAAEIGTVMLSAASSSSLSLCFVAGTIVLTSDGSEVIELIEPGDYVWAWDEESGDVALKRVVETYVNETNELVHIFVNGEEIITTPAHPFYSPVKGWTDAVRLRAGDILVLVNGEYVVVEKIQHEILEAPVAVYNFQVEDYHTYYVADIGVLVHNSCNHNNLWRSERRSFWKKTAETAVIDQDYGAYIATADNISRMSQGLAPKGWDGYSVQLHHWFGIAYDFYSYSPVSRTLHQLIHSTK